MLKIFGCTVLEIFLITSNLVLPLVSWNLFKLSLSPVCNAQLCCAHFWLAVISRKLIIFKSMLTVHRCGVAVLSWTLIWEELHFLISWNGHELFEKRSWQQWKTDKTPFYVCRTNKLTARYFALFFFLLRTNEIPTLIIDSKYLSHWLI